MNKKNWKRTQLRIPHELYQKAEKFAEDNKLSLNSAFLLMIETELFKTGNTADKQLEDNLQTKLMMLDDESKELIYKLIERLL